MSKSKWYTPSRYEANERYKKEHLKRIPLDVQKAMYAEIKAAADGEGKPVNTWIKEAIREKMGAV